MLGKIKKNDGGRSYRLNKVLPIGGESCERKVLKHRREKKGPQPKASASLEPGSGDRAQSTQGIQRFQGGRAHSFLWEKSKKRARDRPWEQSARKKTGSRKWEAVFGNHKAHSVLSLVLLKSERKTSTSAGQASRETSLVRGGREMLRKRSIFVGAFA